LILDVPLNVRVIASFKKLMDEVTIQKTFTVKDNKNGLVRGKVTLEGGNAILMPPTSLRPNTPYIATSVKDTTPTPT
jgi:Bacterial Ig-like domain